MRTTLLLILALFGTSLQAGEIRDFPKLPKREWREVPAKDLPKGIDPDYILLNTKKDPQAKVFVAYADLDLDGTDEILIATRPSIIGATSEFVVYRKNRDYYESALHGDGDIVSLGRRANEPKIEVWSQGEGAEYCAYDFSVARYAFRGNKWVLESTEYLARTANKRLGVISRTSETPPAAQPK